MANPFQTRVPTTIEKEVLQSAGLGQKKIQFNSTDTELDVYERLASSDTNEEGEIIGFLKLGKAGGFELT